MAHTVTDSGTVGASGRAGVLATVLIVTLIQLTGCSRLRLPAIDPSGQRIFNPLPATTSIALPGSAGEGKLGNCFRKLGDPLNTRPFALPTPAFPEPAAPPDCLTPMATVPAAPLTAIGGASTEPCVPSAPCTSDCINGPPAILYGNECSMKDFCTLPKRGKRGCILLSPQKIVAPVGGEVVLLSGICGDSGHLQVGEPLEWMLTPESVGTFIQVGDDDPGVMHRLARIKKASKQDPAYAFGVTSTKRTKITRGNLNPADDVQLEKGQTWITISSPSEGTSKVTVLAPESECWDQRKATSTIYWVDAARQFPGTQIVPAGTPVTLSTRVTRSEGMLPARGWKVYYEIMQPELGSFAGTDGSSFVEAIVDDAGNATVNLIPTPGTSGTAAIRMRVIRPGGETDNMPTLTLFTGETFVTWSAPQLAIRAGAPSIASFGVPFDAAAAVSNPGDQAATNVRVILQIPNGVKASSQDSFAQNLPNAIVWTIGELPPKTELDLLLNVTTESSLPLIFEAHADGGLYATDSVTVDVYQPSLVLSVAPENDRYEVGQPVTFNIDVRNTGQRPLTNLQLTANGDDSMLHSPSNQRSVVKLKQDPNTQEDIPLQPGETWPVAVTFIPTDPGNRCIQVEATADAGQRATSEACVIVINKPPPTPAVTVTVSGRSRTSVGNETLFRGIVVNTGQIPLENVKVTMAYDPQLRPLDATERFTPQLNAVQYMIEWLIPRLEPETSEVLEANFQVIGTNPRSNLVMTVDSQQGARASERLEFEILPGAISQPAPESPRSTLPQSTAPPLIPGPQAVPTPEQPAAPPVAPTQPAEPEALGLSISGPNAAVFVNQPIRYDLKVTNPSSRQDGNVSIRFNLPEGVQVVRITQPLSPELGEWNRNGDQIYLKDIGTLRPFESIDYVILLVSNQAQTFTITAEAVSRGKRLGARSQVTTQVFAEP